MIKINGKYIRTIPEQVGKNKKDIIENSDDITALDQKLNTALAGVFHYKGSVATYSDLPASDNEVGDVYNVIDTGKNYAWSGTDWDDLGGIADLTNFYTKDETDTLLAAKAGLSTENSFSMLQKMNAGLEIKASSVAGNYRIVSTDNSNLYLIYYNEGISATPLKADSSGNVAVGGDLTPATSAASDVGSSSNKWKDIYLTQSLKFATYSIENETNYLSIKNASNVTLLSLTQSGTMILSGTTRPSTNNSLEFGNTNYLWSKVYCNSIANTTDSVTVADISNGIFNVINASDIVSNTLTQAQYDLIMNGKPTLISGTWNGYEFCIIKDCIDYETNNVSVAIERTNIYRQTYFTRAQINKTTRVITFESNYFGWNYQGKLVIDGKTFPLSPSNTGTFVLKCVDGVLTWVSE